MKRFRKIYIEITNFCNLKCKFCLPTKRKLEYMSLDRFKFILDKITPYTDLIYLHLKGEPLLHPELDKILLMCAENNISVNITTNATLLSKVKDKLTSKKALRQINFSLHSLAENDKVIDTSAYLDAIFNFIFENSQYIYSLRLWNLDENKDHIHNYEVIKQVEAAFGVTELITLLKDNNSIKLKDKVYLNQDTKFNWPHKSLEVNSQTGFCYGLRDQIGILVDGTVVPCCLDGDGIISLGNILNSGIEEIINSQQATEIYNGFSNRKVVHELCQRCDFKNRFNI